MTVKVKRDFTTTVAKDFFWAMVGDKLGEGACRSVYSSSIDDQIVIKLENIAHQFQNVKEWSAWNAVMDTRYAKWFAPCIQISRNGLVLVQKRTTPITLEEFPDRIPAFFTDTKLANWGMFEGRPVCHDYGLTNLMSRGLDNKMKKVDKELI